MSNKSLKHYTLTLSILLLTFFLVACSTTNERLVASTYEGYPLLSEQDRESSLRLFNIEHRAEVLAEQFEEHYYTVLNDANDQYILESYQSLDDVKNYFTEVMSESVATEITDTYYEETDEGVEIIPTDDYGVIDPEDDMTVQDIDSETAVLSQFTETELTGPLLTRYTMKKALTNDAVSTFEYLFVTGEDIEALTFVQPIIQHLRDGDFEQLSQYVSEDNGLTLVPYLHVDDESLNFDKSTVANFSQDSSTYLFGYTDGRGEPIDVTPETYYEEYIHSDALQEPQNAYINEYRQNGNSLNNIEEAFPNHDAVVEIHNEGSGEYSGMDWRSLHFVLEEIENGDYVLIGILSDEWTI